MYQNNVNLTCIPFNFAQLEAINQKTGDLNTTLLYAMLRFQTQHSKLLSHGTKTIARSREQLAQFFSLTPSKIDTMVKTLERLHLIRKTVRTWFSKKRLFISVTEGTSDIEIHFRKLAFLNRYTGDTKATLLWARIAFALNHSTIQHENLTWCSIKREVIAKLLCVSLRTADKIIDSLIGKGLIVAKNFVRYKKRCLHFTIPVALHNKITAELAEWLQKKDNSPSAATIPTSQKISSNTVTVDLQERVEISEEGLEKNNLLIKKEPKFGFCREEPAKISKSIRLNTNDQYKNNNTIVASSSKKEPYDDSDINLNTIGTELTRRQLCFLIAAFQKTIEKGQLAIGCEEEVLEEIKYSILNSQQRRGVLSFRHAVSRCMQILRQRTWRTPFGFHRYTEYGKAIHTYREKQLQTHEARKQEEIEVQRSFGIKNTGKLTQQGVRWAQQLSTYLTELKSSNQTDDGLSTKIEFAANKIMEFIGKGADRVAIQSYLPVEV